MLVLLFYLKMSYSTCISNVSSLPTTLQKDQTLKKRPQKNYRPVFNARHYMDFFYTHSYSQHLYNYNRNSTLEQHICKGNSVQHIMTSNECYVAYSASQASLPRKTAIVTNCHIRAFSSKMTWSLAVLAEIVLAGSKNRIQVLIFIGEWGEWGEWEKDKSILCFSIIQNR